MDQPGQQKGGGSSTQQQAEGQSSQEVVVVVEVEDDSLHTVLREEAEEYLSQLARTIGNSEIFCDELQAAVNELSSHDVRRYLYVTQACDHIKDYLSAARDQTEIYIYGGQDSPSHTRGHIQKMREQLWVFRSHRNRVLQMYLMQMPLPQNPHLEELDRILFGHMSLLRGNVKRLLQMAKGELPVDEIQAQATA
ncbi:hypothetical protein DHEL01_v205489 [Diaporthe helianthi]|uniref:Uncharacterized protein n=1 Tax=Diaporthe helianthi TaxID=158607 RepID=A0A2P5I0S3_DIAHE|nr:hypothetical protein DHEL01_v205489 [Diaporthe helianthi]